MGKGNKMEKANLKHPCYNVPKAILDKMAAEKAAEDALIARMNPYNTQAEATAWLHAANIKIKEIIKTIKRGGFTTERKNWLKHTSGRYIFTINGKAYTIYAKAKSGCRVVIKLGQNSCVFLDYRFTAIEANADFIKNADPYIFELFGIDPNTIPRRN
jgi:hypothetical protein